jgi:Cu2+-exporting ATPase
MPIGPIVTLVSETAANLHTGSAKPLESAACYHCGLPIPQGTDYRVDILAESRCLCCRGCEAVAQAIVTAGLEDYYRFRTEKAPQGAEVVPDFIKQAKVYDNPEIQKRFVSQGEGQVHEVSLILEGITCAACVWLTERHLAHRPGVHEVQINYATHRARVRWDDAQVHLSDILEAIAQIGYRAHPYNPDRQHKLLEAERRQQLKRLGLAGALGMQVMMIAVALYFGDWSGMEGKYRTFFHWISLFLTAPVVLYCAYPFYFAAWRDLRQGQVGMDVPVSLGIFGAFTASVWSTVSGQGAVYFDSVVMFVFFLLTARYFELAGRRRASQTTERLVRMTPAVARRLVRQSGAWTEEMVPVVELRSADWLRIRPGEMVPTDGVVVSGHSGVDESLLNGESLPVIKGPGDGLVGGSLNVESPLEMRVTKRGQDTVLSQILRLLDRAQTEKPAVTRLADQAASWFVLTVLILALGVAVYWWIEARDVWFEITLAVLVIACPCALSLATPTAITAATGTLAGRGLLVTRGHTLETLARVTYVVLDKTGTLTEGRVRLHRVHEYSSLARPQLLQIAAALECHSEHPIARALIESAPEPGLSAADVTNTPGGGLRGEVGGSHYVLGTPPFVNQHCGPVIDEAKLRASGVTETTVVVLAEPRVLHGVFELGDEMRPDARQVVQELRREGRRVLLLSGDHPGAAQRAARAVGIPGKAAFGGLSPQQKLAFVRKLQTAQRAIVAMVGDGVNDAPVLAGAQVSIALGSGAQAALASADMIMLTNHLSSLIDVFRLARKTRSIILQNIVWAIGYNALALPAAAMGYVAPWMAAIGMSLSSLLVVANALRLTRKAKVKFRSRSNLGDPSEG